MRNSIPQDDLQHLEKHRETAVYYRNMAAEAAEANEARKQEAETQTGPYFDKWFDVALGCGVVAVLILAWLS